MKQLQFKKTVDLDGVVYSVSPQGFPMVHEVPEEAMDSWYFKALVKEGSITGDGLKAEEIKKGEFPPKPDSKKMEAAGVSQFGLAEPKASKPLSDAEIKADDKDAKKK